MTPKKASIGDALIFMTKAAMLGLALVLGAWVWVIWHEQRVTRLQAKLAEAETTIATQDGHLRTLARWIREHRDMLKERGVTDEEFPAKSARSGDGSS